MKTLDKNSLRVLRADIDAALAGVAIKHGIKLTAGKCTFSEANATFKLEVATIGEGGEVVTRGSTAFKDMCGLYGMKPTHLGQTFLFKQRTYKVTGPQRFMVECERHGAKFKFPADLVVRGLVTKEVVL